MINKLTVAVLPILCLVGCQSMTPTDRGVLGGGAIGAGTGAIIGDLAGNAGAGAAIGGAIGAITGGLIGNEIEQAEHRAQAQAAAQLEAKNYIDKAEIIQMVHGHISDSVIIAKIRSSGTVFHLTAQDVLDLKANGVSDAVIQEMLATAQRARPAAYVKPVYAPRPVYVVEEHYYPRPVVGIGFGYHRRRCGCRH
ncbi:MAG: hypothetical protein KatS3mg105_1010 [Gemmatales bacterium]|nr:MAG: hypothetical protein KatS3mg105_1010 [Gemmatales bacterium]